jgi:hypothetical protein
MFVFEQPQMRVDLACKFCLGAAQTDGGEQPGQETADFSHGLPS